MGGSTPLSKVSHEKTIAHGMDSGNDQVEVIVSLDGQWIHTMISARDKFIPHSSDCGKLHPCFAFLNLGVGERECKKSVSNLPSSFYFSSVLQNPSLKPLLPQSLTQRVTDTKQNSRCSIIPLQPPS